MPRSLLVALGLILVSATANAHGSMEAINGGEVREAGTNHLELVVTEGELVLYVRDEQENPVAIKDALATATVLSGGKAETIELEPGEGNVLRAKANFIAGKGLKVVVSLTMPGKKSVLARFAPFD